MSAMRLNRYLALCGVGSRRQVEPIILEGRVRINGSEVRDLATAVQAGDAVEVDNHPVYPPRQAMALVLHKPPGYVTTRTDTHGRKTVYELLPPGYRTLKYVGRLDLQSRGLLLFTDHGELAHRLAHPSAAIERTYLVWTDPPLRPGQYARLLQGVDIGEGETSRPLAAIPRDRAAEVTLCQGRNREIRRMMAALGREVLDLKRISYGPLELGDLAAGEYRELQPEEFRALCKLVDIDPNLPL